MPSDILYPALDEESGLVMEEKEREEEAERWRQRDSRNETATLPVKGWKNRFTTTATLECARHVSSVDTPAIPGLLSGGGDLERRDRNANTDPDEKPPKLVVNLNQIDKASQIPEPLPPPEDEIEVKKEDEIDGRNNEIDNNCCVDCLYFTMQCCDCSIM